MSSTTRRLARRPREAGQILVLFAGGLLTLLIVAALAFDVGMMLVERRDQQNAADAAALAGARYVMTDAGDPCAALADCPKAETAARRIARENGFDDADPDEVVNVFIQPQHGRYVGWPGFIEVQIEATRPSIFGNVIGRAVWPVGAFAVATNKQDLSFTFAMMALDPTACRAISVSGGGELHAVGTIQSNSDGSGCGGDPSNWVGFARTAGDINVGEDVYCRAFGEFKDSGAGEMDCTKDPNKFRLPDPLAGLPEPTKPDLADPMKFVGPGTAPSQPPKYCPGRTDSYAPVATTANKCVLGSPAGTYADLAWILYEGLYPGGLEIAGGTTAYLMPGIYWIGGAGIKVGGGGGSIMTIDTELDAMANVADVVWEPARDPLGPPNGLGGVLIYNSDDAPPGGPIELNGSTAVIKLMPLDVPPGDLYEDYNNIVVFQDRSLTETVTLNGSASETVVGGLIYAPSAQIKLNGSGGTVTVGQIIAGTYDITGSVGAIWVTNDNLFEAVIRAAGLVD